jgi:hypothetical protein
MLLNGYWMVGNHQIFRNSWTYINVADDSMPSGHQPDFFSIKWNTPILLMAFRAIYHLITLNCRKGSAAAAFGVDAKVLNVDEDLPNFFKSIKPS